jgi:hypothetical protein
VKCLFGGDGPLKWGPAGAGVAGLVAQQPCCGQSGRRRGPEASRMGIARPELRYAFSFAETSAPSPESVYERFLRDDGEEGNAK